MSEIANPRTPPWGWAIDADGQWEPITFEEALDSAEKGLIQLHTSWEDLRHRAARGEFRSMTEKIFWDMVKDLDPMSPTENIVTT